jgi:hypothetical protein
MLERIDNSYEVNNNHGLIKILKLSLPINFGIVIRIKIKRQL